jgi:hypothetical protein
MGNKQRGKKAKGQLAKWNGQYARRQKGQKGKKEFRITNTQ